MGLLQRAKELTRKPKDYDEVRFENGNTDDIIELVRYADSEAAKERLCKEFAPLLRGKTDFETVKNTWLFVRNEIPYKADTAGYERVRLPNKCIWDAYRYSDGGDCKTFCTLTTDLLRENGIDSLIRFISQTWVKKARHVYNVAIVNGEEVPCDGVHKVFNENPTYVYKWDFKAVPSKKTAISKIRGLNTEGSKNYTIF